MVEAKLRVEVAEVSNVTNPFYGNTICKNVIENTLIHDFDKRGNIAPYGVKATFSIDKTHDDTEGKKVVAKEIFDIKVNRYMLDHESENSYLTFFQFDERVFELFVRFDGAHITYITLSEWLSCGYFEDGDDADNIYGATDKVDGIIKGLVSCDILES